MPDPASNVAAQGNPVQSNPLGMLGQVAQTINALNENRLFQARTLAGRYLTESTGPDGQPDPGKLNALLQADPKTAPFAADIMASALSGAGQAIANRTAQTALTGHYSDNLMADYASVPPGPNAAAMRAARISQGIAAGRYPATFASSFMGGGTLPNGMTSDDLAKQLAIESGSESEQSAQMGTATTIDTGGNIVPTAINRATGTTTPIGQPIAKTLTPGEVNTPAYTRTNPDTGVEEIVTKGAAAANPTNPKGIPASLPPGEAEARARLLANQADRANTLQTSFEGSANRKAILQEMLATQGDFRSGPGAAKWSGIVTEFNRIFGTDFANDPASAEQVFGKMAEMVAAGQRDTMGSAATDAQSQAAHLASPNTTYSPEANRRVIAQFLGNEDLIQKKQAAWNAYHAKGGSYNGFVSQFNRAFDPRFFWEGYMTPTQQAEMLNSMSPDERARYEHSKAKAMAVQF